LRSGCLAAACPRNPPHLDFRATFYAVFTIFSERLVYHPNWNEYRSLEGGLTPVEDTLKLRYAAFLICLFLFIAAVDSIPDPPAINPPKSHSCSMSALSLRGHATLLETEWFLMA
jgi:hypothetical protein